VKLEEYIERAYAAAASLKDELPPVVDEESR
jgi:hypothetical protein